MSFLIQDIAVKFVRNNYIWFQTGHGVLIFLTSLSEVLHKVGRQDRTHEGMKVISSIIYAVFHKKLLKGVA